MTGGISAIKGFDYQATVILDRVYEHFDRHGAAAMVRPEGEDDLDLIWTAGGQEARHLLQIKKPREDDAGNRTPTAWSLHAIAQELLPDALKHLARAGSDGQTWILGDSVTSPVRDLLAAQSSAPSTCPRHYWLAAHLVARSNALAPLKLAVDARKALLAWTPEKAPPSDAARALSDVLAGFDAALVAAGAPTPARNAYVQRLNAVHAALPEALGRITLEADYGTEGDVAERVMARLQTHFGLSREVVERSLFRNLRGYVSDIAKQRDRRFDREEFDLEIQSVWPQMTTLRTPPRLATNHVMRPEVVRRLLDDADIRVVEAIGASGSGKSLLAAEAAKRASGRRADQLVFYAEVRPETGLRDVLVGVAAQLRRFGIPQPFAIAVRRSDSDAVVLADLAKAFGSLMVPVLVFADLVDGVAGLSFGHDLAGFLRELIGGPFRMVVLGQESPLKSVSALTREACGVTRVDMPGFDFEQFVELVGHEHAAADRGELYEIFQTVTAGRTGGLVAIEAERLAGAKSLPAMRALAARDPEDMLAAAEAERFARLSLGAQAAAERMLCFALPFRRADAEAVFPDQNVGLALSELHGVGLLRTSDDGVYEMHETIRAGLETKVARATRLAAHAALADWYGARDLVSAQVFHLTKADRTEDAESLAVSRVLAGRDWGVLGRFVTERRLLTAAELIDVALTAETLPAAYLLPRLLEMLGDAPLMAQLLDGIRRRPALLREDHNRAMTLCEMVLAGDGENLQALLQIALESTESDDRARHEVLTWVAIAVRRNGSALTPASLNFIRGLPTEVKPKLLSILLDDGRRDALGEAFAIMISHPPGPGRDRDTDLTVSSALSVADLTAAVEVLAALPNTRAEDMVRTQSPLFGPLTKLLWGWRASLQAHCITLLEEGRETPGILQAAVRLLVLFAEPSLGALCQRYLVTAGPVTEFALAAAGLAPGSFDCSVFEARLFDASLSLPDRALALRVLAALGEDIEPRLAALCVGKDLEFWAAQGQSLAFSHPFPAALPSLLATVADPQADPKRQALGTMVIASLRTSSATTALAGCLSHTNPFVRITAATALRNRRVEALRPALATPLANADFFTAGLIAQALASMGAVPADLRVRAAEPAVAQWAAVLAGRRRDTTWAPELVRLAIDPQRDWRLRRAAIHAAGQLPFSAALEAIHPVVMALPWPLPSDTTFHASFHRAVGLLMRHGFERDEAALASDRSGFVTVAASFLETCVGDMAGPNPPGLTLGVAEWMFDRLTALGWPQNPRAGAQLEQEVHPPLLQAAVLRGLRLRGRVDLIEAEVARAAHPWLAAKALQQAFHQAGADLARHDALADAVARSAHADDAWLQRILQERRPRPNVGPTPAQAAAPATAAAPAVVSFEEAARLLHGAPLSLESGATARLHALTEAQLRELAALADPTHDRERGQSSYSEELHLSGDGRARAQVTTRYQGGAATVADLLRPMIAAADRFGVSPPWHAALLRGPLATTYIARFVDALVALNDSDRFYDVLTMDEGVLFPAVIGRQMAPRLRAYVDDRLAPYLERYALAGTDGLFRDLCAATEQLNSPAADPVLAKLLQRWAGRFDAATALDPHADKTALWQGFACLKRHPRFTQIPNWPDALREVLLGGALRPWHVNDLREVLSRDASAYADIEFALITVDNWALMNVDQVDILDAAAERLFPMTS